VYYPSRDHDKSIPVCHSSDCESADFSCVSKTEAMKNVPVCRSSDCELASYSGVSETEAVRGYQFVSGDSCGDLAMGDPFVLG
jgi:hypothetical protein